MQKSKGSLKACFENVYIIICFAYNTVHSYGSQIKHHKGTTLHHFDTGLNATKPAAVYRVSDTSRLKPASSATLFACALCLILCQTTQFCSKTVNFLFSAYFGGHFCYYSNGKSQSNMRLLHFVIVLINY